MFALKFDMVKKVADSTPDHIMYLLTTYYYIYLILGTLESWRTGFRFHSSAAVLFFNNIVDIMAAQNSKQKVKLFAMMFFR